MADVIQFATKAQIERETMIAQARANYESIFPTAPHCDLTIGRVEQEDNRPIELA